MEKKLQQYKDQLKQRGCRSSALRDAMLLLFLRRHEPLAVATIMEALQKEGKTPNISTVYRELTMLEEAGIVTTVHVHHGVVSYELADLEHHHHAICTSCTKVIDIFVPEAVHKALHAMEEELSQAHDFTVQGHVVDLRGVCKACR